MNARPCVPASATCRTSPSSSAKANSPHCRLMFCSRHWSTSRRTVYSPANTPGPGRGEIKEGFERNLARLFESSETPRLSGVQIKAPMNLDEKGVLTPATHTAFTHILKPAGGAGYEALPLIEWLALAIGSAAGLEAPSTALVAMPDGMPPALLVERFDIRRGANDTRMLALEDLCSVLDLPTSAKYDSTMERIVRAVRPISTAPDEDVLIILRRAVFAWLIADGDMHLKNSGASKDRRAWRRRLSARFGWRRCTMRSPPGYFLA